MPTGRGRRTAAPVPEPPRKSWPAGPAQRSQQLEPGLAASYAAIHTRP